jgi:DNA-binding winged helix-turn-helix (wHTH) protein/tetratricopeptide (TPR) repeat protein
MPSRRANHSAKFGDYWFDPVHLELRKSQTRLRLETKPAQVLALLLARRGELVTRQELRLALWPDDVHLDFEHGLNKSIHKLRAVLSDDAAKPRFIETISRRGYRFVAAVERVSTAGAPEELRKPAMVEERFNEVASPPTGSAESINAPIPRAWFRHLSRRLAVSVVACFFFAGMLVAAALSFSDSHWNPLLRKPARRSVIILGFRNLSGESQEAWLSTALAEWLSTDLSSGGQLRLIPECEVVRARSELGITPGVALSSDQLAGIRGDFHADLVVWGSYAVEGPKESGQIRLDLSIQNTADNETLNTAGLVAPRERLFEVATEAGARLRSTLKLPALTASGMAGVKASLPANPEAAKRYSEGLEQLRTFNAGKAQELLGEAVQLEPLHGLSHFALAQAWTRLGYGEKAKSESQEALKLSSSLQQEQRLLIQGQYHEAMQDWNSAVEDYASLFRFHPDEFEYGLQLARAQISASRTAAAFETWASLRQLPPPLRDDPRLDLIEADAAEAVSDFRRQLKAAALAVENGKRQRMSMLVAQAQLSQGEALRSLGEMPEALELFNLAENTFRSVGDHGGVARALNRQAFVFWKTNHGEEAIEHYEKAIEITRNLHDQMNLAGALAGLGNILIYLDQPVRTQKILLESVAIYSETGNQKEQAYAISLLGDFELLYNHLPRAKELYAQSLILSRQVNDKSRIAGRLMDLGIVDTWQGNLREAAEKLNESLQMYRGLGEKIRISLVLDRSARVKILQGNFAEARRELQESITLREEAGDRSTVWQPRKDLALDLLEMGQAAEAESTGRQSLNEHSYGSEALSWIFLARALLAEGKTAESNAAYQQALNYPAHNLGSDFEVDLEVHHSKLLASEGSFAAAKKELLKADAVARKLGWVPEEMKVRLAKGELALQAGERAQGYKMLDALQHDAKELGFGLFAAKAEAAVALSGSAQIVPADGRTALGNP